jgi:putative ABC transport system permease protein
MRFLRRFFIRLSNLTTGRRADQSFPLAENLLLDIRYAFRMLHRSPGFSLIVIATMALGVGATTAVYSVIDATLLHPLPYPNPSELVRIEDDLPGVGAQDVSVSIPEWKDLENSGIFQYVALDFFGSSNLTGSAQPTRIAAKVVTPNYFAMSNVSFTRDRLGYLRSGRRWRAP